MSAVVHTGAHGHIPQQALGRNCHQLENHAQAAGHGQDDVVIRRFGIIGVSRAHIGLAGQSRQSELRGAGGKEQGAAHSGGKAPLQGREIADAQIRFHG